MKKEYIEYTSDSTKFKGYAAYKPSEKKKRAAVLICHAWMGQDDFAREKAEKMAEMGCVGFAVDMYGDCKHVNKPEEAIALMQPLMEDRFLIRKRMLAALEKLRSLEMVHKEAIAVMGFCFGGACALELVRSGADIKAAICFHGLLQRDKNVEILPRKAAVLALHGYQDPLVSPFDVADFQEELAKSKVNWQMEIYGDAMHAFTNPLAHFPEEGLLYNEKVAKKAWRTAEKFLIEHLSKEKPLPLPPILA